MFRRLGRPGLIGLAARTAVVAGTATAVSGGIRAHQQNKAQQSAEAQAWEAQQQQAAMDAAAAQAVQNAQQVAAPPAAPTPTAPSGGADLIAQLDQLGALHSQGILSDDEFAAGKAKLLG